jgi:hypothetical protein
MAGGFVVVEIVLVASGLRTLAIDGSLFSLGAFGIGGVEFDDMGLWI